MLTPQKRSSVSSRRSPSLGLRLALAALLMAFLVACGGGQAPGISLSLGSGTAEVIRGDSVQVVVTLSRQGGASGTASLELQGPLPANVSASFDPAVLSGSATQSTLTIQAAAGATATVHALTVVASAGSLTDSAALSLDVRSLTVSGRVVGAIGSPVSGIVVSSQGQNAVSSADGTFTLGGLFVPYDLALSTSMGSGALHVFAGLSADDPVVTPAFALEPSGLPSSTATVSGDLLGGDPLPADHHALVCAEGLDLVVLGCDRAGPGDTSYSLTLGWLSADAVPVRLHWLHLEADALDRPVDYHGYASLELMFADGDIFIVDAGMGPLAQGTFSVSLASEGSIPVEGAFIGARVGPNLVMPMAVIEGTDIEVPMPLLSGLGYDVTAMAGSVEALAWRTGLGLDGGTVTVPAAPAMVTPADGAPNVTLATVFTVAAPPDRAKLFLWTPDAAGPAIFLTTTGNSVTIPDPTPYGLSLPSGATYDWQVAALSSGGMGEAALSGDLTAFANFILTMPQGGPGAGMDGAVVIDGETREFQTAP